MKRVSMFLALAALVATTACATTVPELRTYGRNSSLALFEGGQQLLIPEGGEQMLITEGRPQVSDLREVFCDRLEAHERLNFRLRDGNVVQVAKAASDTDPVPLQLALLEADLRRYRYGGERVQVLSLHSTEEGPLPEKLLPCE